MEFYKIETPTTKQIFEDPTTYGKNTKLQPLMRDAKDFGCGMLFVTQVFN